MKTLEDVAARLLGMAQNAADRASLYAEGHPAYVVDRKRMVEFIDMAETINKHISDCPLCKP